MKAPTPWSDYLGTVQCAVSFLETYIYIFIQTRIFSHEQETVYYSTTGILFYFYHLTY